MNVLVLSKNGDCLSIANQLHREGHSVRVWIQNPQCIRMGLNMIDRVVTWRPSIAWCDLVIGDSVEFTKYKEIFSERGKATIGFNSIPDDEYVPSGGDFVAGGVYLSVEGWFNGRDWIRPFNISFIERRLMQGNLGPLTDSMGTLLRTSDENVLIKSTLFPLTEILKRSNIIGPVSCSTSINDQLQFVSKPRCGFRFDNIEALIEGLKEPLIDLLFETARGVKKEMDLTSDYLISVRMSVPPWPNNSPNGNSTTYDILGIDENNERHLYFNDIFLDEGGYKYAAGNGIVMKAAARGRTVREARRRVYRTLDNILLHDKQYRLDIGERADADLESLRSWGYI